MTTEQELRLKLSYEMSVAVAGAAASLGRLVELIVIFFPERVCFRLG